MPAATARRVRGSGAAADDAGQATPEYVGVLAIVATLVLVVGTAFAASSPVLGPRVAEVVCEIVTAGRGACTAASTALSREPTQPCAVRGSGDAIRGVVRVAIGGGGSRTFAWTRLSDGSYRVQQVTGAEAVASVGVGAKLAFVVADTAAGVGADASVKGYALFQGGAEWTVANKEELDRLVSAENWSRLDGVLTAVPGGDTLPFLRRAFGIGEDFPPPDRVFVELGTTGRGSAYAGADGAATASVNATTSRALGYSYEPSGNGERTFYFRTTTQGSALAGTSALGGNNGVSLAGSVTTLTSVTVDSSGAIVSASRSGLATGQSGGLTNLLFGGEPTASTGDRLHDGTQYAATLDVRSDADRDAVHALIAGAGIDAATLGLSGAVATLGGPEDPLASRFMDAVRDHGELTRTGVTTDTSIPFLIDGRVDLGLGISVEGSYSQTDTEYFDPEYWDGTRFVPRSNC